MLKTTSLTGKGIVNGDSILLAGELRDYVNRGLSGQELLDEVTAVHGKVQIMDWISPRGRGYRFFIQELDDQGEPLPEVANHLIVKEFS